MIRRPPRSTRTDTLFPYTTLFRSFRCGPSRRGFDRLSPSSGQTDQLAPFDQDPHRFDWRLRSEEHTSELQSLMRISYAVFCLKKKSALITRSRRYRKKAINTESTQAHDALVSSTRETRSHQG